MTDLAEDGYRLPGRIHSCHCLVSIVLYHDITTKEAIEPYRWYNSRRCELAVLPCSCNAVTNSTNTICEIRQECE